ncbi:MAG TPA: thiamine pyrophosphate-dependent dehydrogenase E1 component subunit alpha [Candidatus Limnocylindrales bacterium]|jgi:2-oxoisovalerate dehydrogenase E1 component alpha subunit|nr:thiamine pyrophosphate-dependent dehydrogenase E1 component subunit alpha [Candidatus Limnocylindrales bacterium]
MAATRTEQKAAGELGADIGLSRDDLLEMYRLMVITRAVDERMWILNRAGKIPFVISGQGHEGAQVGIAYPLQKGHDWMVPYYRSVASLITFGMSPREIMLAQFAKGVDPSSGGRQMPGHYGVAERNILSVSSPVATQLLHATGIAYAAKLRKTGQVAITYIGEGSSNQGDFHEGLNFAGIHKLPVVYVVENNGYAISVPMSLQSAVADIAVRGAGYNMPGIVVDGADVLACYREGKAAIERARSGDGPTLIEAKVSRLTAHSSDDQHTKYRTAEDIEAEKARDPLPLFRDQLRDAGLLDAEAEERMLTESRQVVEDATDWAEAQADPDPATAQRHVYADAPPARMDDPLWTGTRFMGDGGPLRPEEG